MVIVAALLPKRRPRRSALLTRVERERWPTVEQLLREVYGPRARPTTPKEARR